MLTSTSPIGQSSSIIPTSKLPFTNTSSHATTSTNSNGTGTNMGRYSPSNFYRAAAVAAANNESNNRRYMPSAPVSRKEEIN